jgi:Kelch motif
MRCLLSASLAVLLFACQPAVTSPVDAGTDATLLDAGLTCPPTQHVVDGGTCDSSIAWGGLFPGPQARDHHATVVLSAPDGGATLVVAGGFDADAFSDSWLMPLGADGTGTWAKGPNAIFKQAGMGAASESGHAWLVSGRTTTTSTFVNTPRVQSVHVKGDGFEWSEEPALPDGRFHCTATKVGKYLFTVGGRDDSGRALKNVTRAEVLADGHLGPWVELAPLTVARSHHSAVAIGDSLVLIGGSTFRSWSDNGTSNYNVLSAVVAADGSLGPWETQTIAFAGVTSSAVVVDGYLYVIGGFNAGLDVLADVQRAPILSGSTLGAWSAAEPLPFARAHVHHTPAWRNFIYSVGGNLGSHVATDQMLLGVLY